MNAAKDFIERHSGHLEQLDLSVLLSFDPLQEVIIEKLGTRPELFSSIGLTVTEYLKQAPSHDARLFIWALEEHRDMYISCHSILDEYFDMMGTYIRSLCWLSIQRLFALLTEYELPVSVFSDGHCSVLKKSGESQTVSLWKHESFLSSCSDKSKQLINNKCSNFRVFL